MRALGALLRATSIGALLRAASVGVCIALVPSLAVADNRLADARGTGARLAVVIDDLGPSRAHGLDAVALPATVTLAVLPFSAHAEELARRAHDAGKPVIVHLPMQSMRGHFLGRGGLTTGLPREQFVARVNSALDAVPFASGANNHMGSLLTADHTPMTWLMDTLAARRGWVFLDSRTTRHTVAAHAALAAGVPVVSRDVFLDNDRSRDGVWRALGDAVALARTRGSAVAIGHPHRATLDVLAHALPRLAARGIHLVPLTELARSPARLLYTRLDRPQSSDGQAPITR